MYSNHFKDITNHNGSKIALNSFIKQKLSQYSSKRNYDFGDPNLNYVSVLSPAIRMRILTEINIIHEVKKCFNYNRVEKFIDEICWRTYWKGYLQHRPKIWIDYLNDLEDFDIDQYPHYLDAIEGNTSIPCFNIWVKDLKQHGYLHNHTRMWFASIWIFQLNLPWQLGANLFFNHLLDADPASNTLSWRWVAGLHTKGKSYRARRQNIEKYTSGRINTYGVDELPTHAITDERIYTPMNLSLPKPIDVKKGSKTGLIIHQEDLSIIDFKKYDFLLIQSSNYNPHNQSNHWNDFIDQALKNYILQVKKTQKNKLTVYNWDNLDDIRVWKEKNKITHISIPYPSVGLLEKPIFKLEEQLDVRFNFLINQWDELFWPYCDKGFFKLKKKIKPNLDILLNSA